MIPSVLSIAGSDPSGGAGVQADLKTFGALGTYGMCVLTALTAQNTLGVQSVHSLPKDFVGEQMESIFQDICVSAVKIGMLERAEIIEEVSLKLLKYHPPIVLDPVMLSKNGSPLLKADAIEALKQQLIPLASLLTPNIPEAEALLAEPIRSSQDMEIAAQQIAEKSRTLVLLKGGHLSGTSSSDCLFLYRERKLVWLLEERVHTQNTHGTGCTLSSAIAAFLARGLSLEEAVRAAKNYLTKIIRASVNLGIGSGVGPLHHFFY